MLIVTLSNDFHDVSEPEVTSALVLAAGCEKRKILLRAGLQHVLMSTQGEIWCSKSKFSRRGASHSHDTKSLVATLKCKLPDQHDNEVA